MNVSNYFSRKNIIGLALLASTSLYSAGCATPFHEVFRNNEAKNEAPIAKIISIDEDYNLQVWKCTE